MSRVGQLTFGCQIRPVGPRKPSRLGRFRHVTSRVRSLGIVGLSWVLITGCDDAQIAGPIPYRESDRAVTELATKPKLRETIQTTLVNTFGPDLRHIKVPENSGLREGGIYLADRMKLGDKVEPVTELDSESGRTAAIDGGYALYRNNCLQCHGVFGAGDGPTSTYLFPKPRDYRPGIFKFTSTNPANAKPSRADLRKTLLYGLHGTSMPGFEATMTASQIEQVIDYMTFLSIRGEIEIYLINEAANTEDKDAAEALGPDVVGEIVQKVTSSWKEAETQVVNPTARRVEASQDSVKRGRDLYLGINTSGPKLECVGCHGIDAKGNGSAFIDRDIFDDVVFRGDSYPFGKAVARTFEVQKERSNPHESSKAQADPAGVAKFLEENPAILGVLRKNHHLLGDDVTNPQFDELVKADMPKVADAARKILPDLDDPGFRSFLVSQHDLWTRGSLDVWNNPLRAANLVDGIYKGGRRPIDLYWRLAKGINGAKMPAHSNILSEDQIWDVVNFILALPDQPDLLKTPVAPKTATAPRPPDRGTR